MRISLRPRSLFAKATLTLTIAFVYFALFTLAAVAYYVQVPVAKRSADDLAAFILVVARSWSLQPSVARDHYASEVYKSYGLRVAATQEELEEVPAYLPYLAMLDSALKARSGDKLPIGTNTVGEERWYWVEMQVNGQYLRVGFPRSRIGSRTPAALLLVLLGSTALVLITAMILTRRITRPLRLLSEAAESVGRGQEPEPLPETGAAELAALIRRFNHMSHQVRELIANRTTLLAGISHDLRTPLARMRLALEMLPPEKDPDLLEGIKQDLERMNQLIADALELSRDLEAGRREPCDLSEILGEMAVETNRMENPIEWTSPPSCVLELNLTALRRIVGNLLENALRYGAGNPVTLTLDCAEEAAVIGVLDRGPGIPAEHRDAVFRPFHRLEQSRSTDTGGSGLGMAIARQLADANGWTIRILDREGGGTRTEVRLPPKSKTW